MKTAGKVILYFLIGIVGSAAFFAVLIFGSFALAYFGDELLYPKFRVEWIYARNEEEFNAVVQYIDNFDLSPYEKEATDRPRISIFHHDPLPENSKYTGWIFSDKTYDLIIDDDSVNAALDQLFREVGVIDIDQTYDESARSVYFFITYSVGLVHSKSGDVPVDYPDDVGYTFKRINDNWFYWKN